MRVIKLTALVMIYLVLSLIFFSAAVFATIYKAEAYGQDKAPGIIRSSDNLEIRTESVMNTSVKADFTNNTYEPMSCGFGTPTVCTYTWSVSNVTGMISANVKEALSGDTADVEAYVDNLAPTISSFTTTSLGNMVKASYSVVDKANEYAPADKCSGLKKIELYINSQVVNTTNHSVGQCSASGELRGTIDNYIGKVNISIMVYDYVGFSANKTGNQVFIDTIPPRISSSAKVFKAGTQEEIRKISTTSSKVWDADVEVEVEDNALPASKSVYGDFSMLDKTNSIEQGNVEGRCSRQGWNQTYKCVFSNLKLSPAEGQPLFMITAKDQAGNSANQSVSVSFTVINDAGTVTRLGPDPEKCYQGTCYLRPGTQEITADISTGSSFNESSIRIEGSQAVCAYNNTWACKNDIGVTGAKLSLEGFDDLGNPIKAESDLTLVLDSTPPSRVGGIEDINVTPMCPIGSRGESLQIRINVTETQSPEVIIKTNPLAISTDNESTAKCVQTGTGTGLWNCVLTIGNLKNIPVNTNLNIIIKDFTGNQLTQSVPVSVCIEVSEIPDLIDKIKTRGTLPKIDRRTASKIIVKVPIGLEIVKKEEAVEIIEKRNIDCSDTPGISGSAYIINDDSLKPILVLSLRNTNEWGESDKIKINCTREFYIKHNNRIYTQPETEYISAELDVYNQALGTITQNYHDLIDEKKQRLTELDEHIKKWEKWDDILGSACDWAEIIGKANSVIQAAKAIIYGILVGLTGLTFGLFEAVAIPVWKNIQGAFGSIDNHIQRFIWPSGWIPHPANKIGLLVKASCAIYTCKFYDFNTYVDIFFSLATSYMNNKDKQEEAVQKNREELLKNIALYDPNFDPEVYLQYLESNKGFSLQEALNSFSLSPYYNDYAKHTLNPYVNPTISSMFNYKSLSYNPDAALAFTKAFPAVAGVITPYSSLETQRVTDHALNSFVGDGSWIINPYKSKHYDAACVPAILFNDKKEKQLTCKYLTCIETVAATSGDLEVCDFDYQLGMCLYVDSAQYKLQGTGAWTVFKNIGRSFMNNIMGVGITLTYLFLVPGCFNYQLPMGFAQDEEFNTGGLHSAACGIMDVLFSARELLSFREYLKDTSPTDIKGQDFCSGVNY